MDHLLVVPSHKLLLCRIEKVANSVLSSLMCSLNKGHVPGAEQPHRQKIGDGLFDFEDGCDWHTAEALNMHMSIAELKDALTPGALSQPFTKVVFYREPLERFLSGYLSKCTAGRDPEYDSAHVSPSEFEPVQPALRRLELTQCRRTRCPPSHLIS